MRKRKTTKLSKYLDNNYPLVERKNIIELNISFKNLIGTFLKLNDFANLQNLKCSNNQLTFLNLTNCENLEWLDCSYNKLSSLILTNCSKLKEIRCNNNQLTNLKLINKPCLTYLNFSDCDLIKLELSNNPLLAKIDCSNNNNLDADFLNGLNAKSLNFLDIRNNKRLYGRTIVSNNVKTYDLSLFSRFIGLEYLYLANNYFVGSLLSLNYCQKLKELCIRNIPIAAELEYLPESLKTINCSGELAKQIKNYGSDYQAWRENNSELIKRSQKVIELANYLIGLKLAFGGKLIKDNAISKGLLSENCGLTLWTRELIVDLKKEIEKFKAQIQIS